VEVLHTQHTSVGARQRLVDALDRAGLLRGVMQLRRFAPFPIVGVVTFHHIHDTAGDPSYPYDPDVADATPEQFRRRLELLARIGTPIGMEELMRGLEGAPLPPNPVMITFDDGYRSCHDVALPILRELGIPATFFVSTSFVTERRMYWWERTALAVRAAPRKRVRLTYPAPIEIDVDDPNARRLLNGLIKDTKGIDIARFLTELYAALDVEWSPALDAAHAERMIMTWDQARALERAGMRVESHTRHHHVLETLDDDGLRDELEQSRFELERELGHAVHAIAYPVGRRVQQLRILMAVAAAGYRLGFANSNGINVLWPAALRNTMAFDPLDLRRISTSVQMSDAMFLAQLAFPPLGY
jgi:peptidoglycan/xylan/chitin deacetylase (PgdA/CDA1 family)